MKTCPFCAEEIQDAAIVCKHCGRNLPAAPPKPKPIFPEPLPSRPQRSAAARTLLVIVTVIAGLLALMIAVGIVGAALSSGPSRSVRSEHAEAGPGGPIHISAIQLSYAYGANEVAADQTYKGKVILVDGRIDTIGKDILDSPYVTFDTGGAVLGLQAVFPRSDEDRLAALKREQYVSVQCLCTGKLVYVVLKDCGLK